MKRKRKSPNLTPEQRAASSARMKAVRANPELERRRRAGWEKSMKRKLADPEYLQVAREHLSECRQLPKRYMNFQAAMARLRKDKAYRKALSEKMRRQRRDPDFIARMNAGKRSPEGKRNRSKASTRTWARLRGFAIPKDKRQDYFHLVWVKKLSPREAGAMLGLIPEARPT